MRKLLLAAALILGSIGIAEAQNIQCPTRPANDSSNACANTAWVKANAGGGAGGVGSGTAGQIAIYPTTGTNVSGATISGDCTVAITGALTCTKTNGTALGPAATATSASTNVNGQNCTLGGSCTISAAAALIVNSSTVSGGTSNGLFYNNAGTFGNLTTLNNGVLITSASGVPSISTTVPNGLAFGTPASLNLTNATALPTSALTGTLLAAQEPAHTGDMTNTAGSLTTAVNSIGGKAVTLGGGFSTSGAFAVTFTLTGTTTLTLPTSGTVTALGNAVTGSGAIVLATSPILTTPNLGVPTFLTLTNATGLPLTTGVTGILPIANGGSGQSTALAARGASGFIIDNLCTFGDNNFTPAATCRQLATTTAFTAARTLTVPAASTVNPGQVLVFVDAASAITATNTLTIARSSSDTINGAASQTLSSPTYGSGITLYSNGVNAWSYTPSGGSGGGSGTVTQVTAGGSLTAAGGATGGSITSAGTIDFSNQARGNALLDRINIAKQIGTAQRGVGTYSDGFGDGTGIASGSSSGYTPNYVAKTISPTPGANRDVLLHFDGTNGATTTTDSGNGANAPHTVALTGTTTLSTAQIKFGTASMLVPGNGLGTNGARVTAATDLNMSAGPFTAECQFYLTAYPNTNFSQIFGNSIGSGNDSFVAGILSNGGLAMTSPNTGMYSGTASQVSLNVWHQLLYTRDASNNGRLFYDGALITTITDSRTYGSYDWGFGKATGAAVSGTAGQGLDHSGYLDECATLKGTAVYTAAFTPPVAPYSTSTQNMTLVSTAQTADASVANARAAFVISAAPTLTWGTDATIEVTNNGGTNWTAATPINLGAVQNGNLWEIPDTAVTAGTSFLYRFKTLTNKSPVLYGASNTVH